MERLQYPTPRDFDAEFSEHFKEMNDSDLIEQGAYLFKLAHLGDGLHDPYVEEAVKEIVGLLISEKGPDPAKYDPEAAAALNAYMKEVSTRLINNNKGGKE